MRSLLIGRRWWHARQERHPGRGRRPGCFHPRIAREVSTILGTWSRGDSWRPAAPRLPCRHRGGEQGSTQGPAPHSDATGAEGRSRPRLAHRVGRGPPGWRRSARYSPPLCPKPFSTHRKTRGRALRRAENTEEHIPEERREPNDETHVHRGPRFLRAVPSPPPRPPPRGGTPLATPFASPGHGPVLNKLAPGCWELAGGKAGRS